MNEGEEMPDFNDEPLELDDELLLEDRRSFEMREEESEYFDESVGEGVGSLLVLEVKDGGGELVEQPVEYAPLFRHPLQQELQMGILLVLHVGRQGSTVENVLHVTVDVVEQYWSQVLLYFLTS